MCAGISVFLQILVVMSVRVCVLLASFYRYCYAPHLANSKKAGLVACGALKSIATATGFCPAVCVLVCLCGSASRGRIIIILPCPQSFLFRRTSPEPFMSFFVPPCPALPCPTGFHFWDRQGNYAKRLQNERYPPFAVRIGRSVLGPPSRTMRERTNTG